MDLVDVDSDKWTQYAVKKHWPLSWLYRLEGWLLSRYEKRVAEVFDATILVSDAEAAVFRQRTGLGEKIHGIANGVDLEYFRPNGERSAVSGQRDAQELPDLPASRPPSDGAVVHRLVFCGAMDYYPNVDAVTWFAREVLPLVRETVGEVEFSIVGSNPSEEVRILASLPGITVTGRVEDVRPYVWEADISVAPIRVARGIQNKVLEAMAMGKPVVSTPEAFEGIDAEPGRDLRVCASESHGFAEALAELLRDGNLSARLGCAARERVQKAYGWGVRLERLEGLLPDCG